MCLNSLPFITTILITSMKYVTGFSLANICAQYGMLSREVNNPLIRMKIIIIKKANDMACC